MQVRADGIGGLGRVKHSTWQGSNELDPPPDMHTLCIPVSGKTTTYLPDQVGMYENSQVQSKPRLASISPNHPLPLSTSRPTPFYVPLCLPLPPRKSHCSAENPSPISALGMSLGEVPFHAPLPIEGLLARPARHTFPPAVFEGLLVSIQLGPRAERFLAVYAWKPFGVALFVLSASV